MEEEKEEEEEYQSVTVTCVVLMDKLCSRDAPLLCYTLILPTPSLPHPSLPHPSLPHPTFPHFTLPLPIFTSLVMSCHVPSTTRLGGRREGSSARVRGRERGTSKGHGVGLVQQSGVQEQVDPTSAPGEGRRTANVLYPHSLSDSEENSWDTTLMTEGSPPPPPHGGATCDESLSQLVAEVGIYIPGTAGCGMHPVWHIVWAVCVD